MRDSDRLLRHTSAPIGDSIPPESKAAGPTAPAAGAPVEIFWYDRRYGMPPVFKGSVPEDGVVLLKDVLLTGFGFGAPNEAVFEFNFGDDDLLDVAVGVEVSVGYGLFGVDGVLPLAG